MPPSETTGATAVESPVVDGLRQLYTAFQKSSIYAPGHPAAVEAIRHSSNALTQATSGDESLLICVGRDRLMLDGETLKDASGALQSLAGLLHDLNVSALRIDAGLQVEEMDGLVQTLGQARRDGLHGDDLAEMLERSAVRHLRIVATQPKTTDTNPVQIDSEDDVWDSLESMLTDEEPSDDDVAPEDIAEQVHQELARNEGTGVGELRERIQDVSREIDTLKSERRQTTRDRLSKFVAALNPKLRQDLLRFDVQLAGDSFSLMTEAGDVMPEPDLLEALQNLDRAGARVPEQLLLLMSKLTRVARTRPTLASGLQDTMSKWGVSATAMGDETNLRAALEEVFRRRDRVDCNPIPHQELLDTLARYQFDAPSNLSLSRYRSCEDIREIRRHTAEIAARMIALPSGGKYRPGLFHYLEMSTERLIDAGLFEQVRDVAVAAKTYSIPPADGEGDLTYRAAQSYLKGFKEEDRLRQILGSACTLDPFPTAAIDLLGLCGDRAVEAALTGLVETEFSSAIEALQGFLASRDIEQLRPRLESRLHRGWGCWQKIFVVLRRLPKKDATQLAELLLSHDEFEVRREALILLHDFDGDRELRLEKLKRALTHDSSRFARVAVRCLAEMGGDEPIEILGSYLDGSLGVTPLYDAGVRAAHSLLRLKEVGVARLCRASERMRKSLVPRRAVLGLKVVELLATEDDPRAKRCVEKWRFSPARLVGSLFGRTTGARGAR